MRGSPSSRVSVGKVQQGLFFFFLTNPNPFLLLFFCFSLAFPRNSPEVSLLGGTDRQAGALLCSRTPGD